jgi:hypothetical protein
MKAKIYLYDGLAESFLSLKPKKRMMPNGKKTTADDYNRPHRVDVATCFFINQEGYIKNLRRLFSGRCCGEQYDSHRSKNRTSPYARAIPRVRFCRFMLAK